MVTKKRSANSIMGVDPQRSAAMKGNTNASKGGVRTAIAGSFVPFGNFAGGAALAVAGKDQKALSRHTKMSVGLNAIGGGISGAIAGTAVMPIVGTAVGGIVGSSAGAAAGYINSKAGQWVGKKFKGK